MTTPTGGDIVQAGMFTKKPDLDQAPASAQRPEPLQRPAERPGSDPDSLGDRPLAAGKRQSGSRLVPSIIGEDLTIIGNVVSKGEIQVDGTIQGDVNCGSLLLGDKSHITGGVTAEDVVVRGRVTGSIRGLRVTLQSQSHVEGDIYHQSLAIEQGAYFEGKSRRSDNPLAAPKAAGEAHSSPSGSDGSAKAGTPVQAAR